ncbi:interferon regulatory factor 2 isoform X3 [Engraulis encrasicolus]|uniref:interferon regulatory factor 2 isoform X3 n=1 Tax=Engraulis encrasicolus TaxID=184585 RepID=UPI002FD781F1
MGKDRQRTRTGNRTRVGRVVNVCPTISATEKRIFQIPWMHAARHGWDVEKDAPLFRNWAIHTGKYQPEVDKPDPKTWKANFRCAMNSLPDIEEVKDKSIKKGTNAFRVYKMLSTSERQTKRGHKRRGEREEKIKVEPRSPHWEGSNGYSMFPGAGLQREEVEPRSPQWEGSNGYSMFHRTGFIKEELMSHPMSRSPGEEQVIIPEVCQTIEVITENEEQSVTSSHHYPLQISPVSTYGDSDTESVHSEEDNKEAVRAAWPSSYSSAMMRMPSCSLPSMDTFVTSSKAVAAFTTSQGILTSRWASPPFSSSSSSSSSSSTSQLSATATAVTAAPLCPSGQTASHETRASVIMKTSDVSKSVKSC